MIVLKCLYEGGKLRIRFHCFINQENIIYTNVYNNAYNCRFPKNIRTAGAYYKVNDGDISLCRGEGGAHYSIKRSNIKVMSVQEIQNILNPPAPVNLADIRIFDAGECVICLSSASAIVFLPCAHRCTCSTCNSQLKLGRYECPVCRKRVEQEILS
jgi:hypothetical protein